MTYTDAGIRHMIQAIGNDIDIVLGPAPVLTKAEYLAILRMLVERATWTDRWRARKHPGHWLNRARRDLLVG